MHMLFIPSSSISFARKSKQLRAGCLNLIIILKTENSILSYRDVSKYSENNHSPTNTNINATSQNDFFQLITGLKRRTLRPFESNRGVQGQGEVTSRFPGLVLLDKN